MESRRYSGGDAANLGVVKRLNAKTFREFVQRYLSLPLQINVTNEHFWELPKEKRDELKRTGFVTPAVFPCKDGATNPRRLEFAGKVSLICLDIDDPAAASPLYNSPELLEGQLEPFGFALYRTANCRPTSPRVRLMVDAEALPHERYEEAVEFVARRVGLRLGKMKEGTYAPESYEYTRAMYLPVIFLEAAEEDHPLLAAAFNGRRGVTEMDLDSDKEADDLLGIERPDRKFKTSTATLVRGELTDLDYLQAPVEGVDVEDIREALEYVDPDLPYAEWIGIAAGMKHQFPKGEASEKAFEVFNEWSARGDKYSGEEDCRAKWGSFRPTPRGRLPRTIRTVLRAAADNGWSTARVTDKCFEAVVRWIEGCGDDLGESRFVMEALGRVAAVPMLSNTEEESLLQSIRKVMHKRYSGSVTLTALKKDLKDARMAEREKAPKASTDVKRDQWMQNLVYVENMDKFYRRGPGLFYSQRAVDSAYGRYMPNTGGDSIVAASRPEVRPSDYLLNTMQIPTMYDIVYEPGIKETTVTINGFEYVNSYAANHPVADAKLSEYAGGLFMGHVKNLIRDEAYRRTLMDWFAWIVQNPGHKVRWAVVIQGAQGCGKTFFFEAMRRLLGEGHAATVGPESLSGQWNEWAMGKQLIALEEVRVAGRNRHEIMNKLKPLVTNDVVGINARFKDSRDVHNVTNYIIFTNHHDALPLSEDDRRYFVLKCIQQTKAQVKALSEGGKYFERLFGMLDTHICGLRHYFETWRISDGFNPDGEAPMTRFSEELARHAESPLRAFIKDMQQVKGDKGPVLLSGDIISVKTLTEACEAAGVGIEGQSISTTLMELGYSLVCRKTLVDGCRHALYASHEVLERYKNPIMPVIRLANEELSRRGLAVCEPEEEEEEDLL